MATITERKIKDQEVDGERVEASDFPCHAIFANRDKKSSEWEVKQKDGEMHLQIVVVVVGLILMEGG